MNEGSNDGRRRAGFLAFAVSSACILVIGAADGTTMKAPPPSSTGRVAIPSIVYLGIPLNDIVLTYEKYFALAGFSIKKRYVQNLGDNTHATGRTFALQTIKAPYYAEVTYVFQPAGGTGKMLRIRVSRPTSTYAYGGELEPKHEAEVREILFDADRNGLQRIEKVIGSHRLHQFDSPEW
jgi:hypothetical protein